MSAAFDVDLAGETGVAEAKRCAVVSIYEDLRERDLLFQLCDCLAATFKGEVQFEFDWWRFKYLADAEMALEAAQKAARAVLILLAPRLFELPAYVQAWLEGWGPNRAEGDGALVLVQPIPKEVSRTFALRRYLRLTAERAHLDYFRLNPPLAAANLSGPNARLPLPVLGLSDLPADDHRHLHWGINE